MVITDTRMLELISTLDREGIAAYKGYVLRRNPQMKSRRSTFLIIAAGLAATALMLIHRPQPDPPPVITPPEQCTRAEITYRWENMILPLAINWTDSGIVLNRTAVIPNVAAKHLSRYQPTGLRQDQLSLLSGVAVTGPRRVALAPDGFLLVESHRSESSVPPTPPTPVPTRVLSVRADLSLAHTLKFPMTVTSGGRDLTVRSVTHAVPFADGILIAGQWGSGQQFFAYLNFDNILIPVSFSGSAALSTDPAEEKKRLTYADNFNVLATNGSRAFILITESTPWIATLDLYYTGEDNSMPVSLPAKRLAPLNAWRFPDLEERPDGDYDDPDVAEWKYSHHLRLEHNALPVGLLTSGTVLYLIIKTARQSWFLQPVSPHTGKLSEAIQLPVTTSWLTLMPGHHRIALLTHGSVSVMGNRFSYVYRPVRKILFFPRRRLESPGFFTETECRDLPDLTIQP